MTFISAWSNDPPTEPGLYFWRLDTKHNAGIYSVYLAIDGLWWQGFGCSGKLKVESRGQWSGPIEPPEG